MVESVVAPDLLQIGIRTELGEGPVWDGERLHFVDILGRRLHSAALDGSRASSIELPGLPGFAVPHADGGWLIGFQDGLWRRETEDADWRRVWQAPHDPQTHRLNDGKVDPQGRCWFGSMSYAEKEPSSALYRLAGGAVDVQLTGVITSNGLDWSPDRKTFYYTDSIPRVIWAFDYDPDTGAIANRREFARDPEGYVPDGGCVDDDGCFWSVKWNGARIVRYTPAGKIDLVWHLPVANPTSCTFVGPDRSVLAVTTALAQDGSRAHKLDGSVLLIQTATTGPASTPARDR